MNDPPFISARHRRSPAVETAAAVGLSLLLVAVLTAAALILGLNAPSAGFVLLVGVLIVASRRRLLVATAAAVGATLAYNYFFFPPKRTLHVSDPENWIALVTFLLTSLLANRLLVRERLQAESARMSREEIEALYEMSVALLRGSDASDETGRAIIRYLDRIGAASGGVILFGSSPQHQQVLAWTGVAPTDEVEDIAAGTGRHGAMTEIPSAFGRDVCVPLTMNGKVGGVLIARGRAGTGSALQSAANVVAFALERERFLGERVHLAALREANELKTSLLQAVSHDLKSPLTVLSVESETLERMALPDPAAISRVRAIRREVGRLHRRIDNLLSVARFEAGIVSPRTEPTPAADLFRAARESLPTVAATRTIATTVGDNTPDLLVDPSLALEIVVNLIENADHGSPSHCPIELCATPSPDSERRVWLEVRDRGAGLTPEQFRQVRTMDPPDAGTRGLGIELARRLAALSGGTVEWFDRPGGGTIARVELPAAEAAVQESA